MSDSDSESDINALPYLNWALDICDISSQLQYQAKNFLRYLTSRRQKNKSYVAPKQTSLMKELVCHCRDQMSLMYDSQWLDPQLLICDELLLEIKKKKQLDFFYFLLCNHLYNCVYKTTPRSIRRSQ